MSFMHIKTLKNRLFILSGTIVSIIAKAANSIYDTNQLYNQENVSNKNGQDYWKNRIFSNISIIMLVFGAPLLFFGAYMFYRHGNMVVAVFQILEYFIAAIVITQKSLSIRFRKLFIVLSLYLISVVLLITTGVMGAGMVCVMFSLILVGCLLDKKQIYQFVIINILIFIALTALLMNGFFDEMYMGEYKDVWYINAITTQLFGISLIFLMNTIFNGLENQTKLINKSKEAIAASENRHKAMIGNISDVIIILDENGIIKYSSQNIEESYGWIKEDISNKQVWEKVHPEERDYIIGEFQSIIKKSGLEKNIETRYLDKIGMVRYLELTAVNMMKDPDINGILLNYHDITERKLWEKEILYINYHDSLTGLHNRTFFEKELARFDTESLLPVSTIIGDINGLKIINDSLGHAEGDKLLVAIARILRSCCRKEDIIARVGGDEFIILLPRTNSETAYEIIKKINLACEEYNKEASSETHYTNISLGYETKTNMSESLVSILKVAEDNMCRRKLLECRSLHSSIISSMKTVLFEKSQGTEEHAHRLIKLSKAVGQGIGLSIQQFDELELFSTLHDIGKIGINDQILNKAGKLTDKEWVEMKKHCEVGYRIAMSSPELMPIADYILTHHERWDGKGYPQGLSGENIPMLSRILAVVDAYDAMIEDRPYRKAMSKEDAITEIINNAGTQLDPNVSKIFVSIILEEDL